MAWNAPVTWVTGEIVTAAKMIAQIFDNFTYFKDVHEAGALSSTIHNNTSFARFYLSANQATSSTATIRIELDANTYDLGTNFQTAKWAEGAADADITDATHIHDENPTTGAGFAATMLGAKVTWDSSNSVGYITAYTNVSTVTIEKISGATAMASGQVYTINHADYKVPVAGYHRIIWSATIAPTVVAAKRYSGGFGINGISTTLLTIHSSVNDYMTIVGSDMRLLAANDLITMIYSPSTSGATAPIYGATAYTYMVVELVKAT